MPRAILAKKMLRQAGPSSMLALLFFLSSYLPFLVQLHTPWACLSEILSVTVTLGIFFQGIAGPWRPRIIKTIQREFPNFFQVWLLMKKKLILYYSIMSIQTYKMSGKISH